MATTTDTIRRILVGGEWYETGETLDVTSPFDGSTVARVAYGGREDARRAVDAAARAMETPVPAHERAAVLDRVAGILRERRDEFARTIAQEAGKPISTAQVEADRAVQTITFSAVEARALGGELIGMDAHPAGVNHAGMVIRRPIGVVGAISPFNFPLNLVAHKVGPAFAAGCACVLKPATATPLSALLLAQAFADAGQPAGWLNVVVGNSSEIGDVLIEDPRVALITFTGSSEVGWKLRERAARKKVNLELGNSTPVIVMADADLDKAAAAVAANGYAFAGQSCISVQRVYVEEAAYDDFVRALTPKVEALVTGDPLDPATQVGPVIDEGNRDRILTWVKEAVDGGATLLAGGEADEQGLIRPTLLGGVDLEMQVACREVFGPVVALAPVKDIDDAIERANGTDYGLQAGVYTRDMSRALRAAERLDFGGVTLNEAPTWRADQMPYGGVKESGNTREGPKYAVREMTEPRLVVIGY
ncbi:MAG TPA: aldehyde dehydrogenase family protein [Gaiellales bacterium]|jgi:acyl-CoA reductase-like NAD-dependent aldehyde dehydrogenase|nr:aldehyde dehydrogenase family protein [Gaiellales bacterium]